jgi:hypothetical protein
MSRSRDRASNEDSEDSDDECAARSSVLGAFERPLRQPPQTWVRCRRTRPPQASRTPRTTNENPLGASDRSGSRRLRIFVSYIPVRRPVQSKRPSEQRHGVLASRRLGQHARAFRAAGWRQNRDWVVDNMRRVSLCRLCVRPAKPPLNSDIYNCRQTPGTGGSGLLLRSALRLW